LKHGYRKKIEGPGQARKLRIRKAAKRKIDAIWTRNLAQVWLRSLSKAERGIFFFKAGKRIKSENLIY